MKTPSPHSNTESVEQILADLFYDSGYQPYSVVEEALDRLFNLIDKEVIGPDYPSHWHNLKEMQTKQRARLRKVFNKVQGGQE